MDFEAAREFILHELRQHLPADLPYHSYAHTLDVYASSQEIALQEGVMGEDLTLLKTAALYHDTGFMRTYQAHEHAGCDIAREHLPHFGYQPAQIERICGMIMATRVPQRPNNLLEEIICDADLYYLGRDDFFPIGRNLYREFKQQGIISNENDWNQLQVRFLSQHHYFTDTARRLRASRKADHLAQIQQLIS